MSKNQHPFEILQTLGKRSKETAKGLPQQAVTRSLWSGIGFQIGDISMVSPLTQVNEILHYPDLTLVPGTLPWVKGLANIRGSLIPIMDLPYFMDQTPIHIHKSSRILVIQQNDLSVGLLVNNVLGLKHFDQDSSVTRIKKMDPAITTYIRGAFNQDDQLWHIFDMSSLTENPQFYKVAI